MQFKSTPGLGAEIAHDIASLKQAINDRRAEAGAAVRTANEAKARIEALAKQLADIRSGVRPDTAHSAGTANTNATGGARPASAGSKKGAAPAAGKAAAGGAAGPASVSGAASAAPEHVSSPVEDEAKVSADLGEAKRVYRMAYERLQVCKEAAATLGGEVNSLLAVLLRDFETWYASCTGRLPPIPLSPTRDRSGSPFKSGARQQGFGATATYDWAGTLEAESKGEGPRGVGGVGFSGPVGSSSSGYVGGLDGGGDVLDDAEAFEKMELAKVTAVEPDSAAYFTATRRIRQGAKSFGKRT
jgi:hypothetical protein